MPDHLDFDSARRALEEIPPTDTWDDATLRAATGPLVQLDAEDATVSTPRRRPRRLRPPTIGVLAIAACLVAVVALAAVVTAERQSVDTISPSESPTTECPSPTQPRAITQGAQMNRRFAAPVASAATAVMLLGACTDDGPTTLARGNVEFVGDSGLSENSMDITAEEEDGEVTGEAQFNEIVVAFECADTDTDGLVILGGEITTPSLDNPSGAGELMAVIIREGDPDRVNVWFEGEDNYGSCQGLLDAVPEGESAPDSDRLVDVEAGDDIETG